MRSLQTQKKWSVKKSFAFVVWLVVKIIYSLTWKGFKLVFQSKRWVSFLKFVRAPAMRPAPTSLLLPLLPCTVLTGAHSAVSPIKPADLDRLYLTKIYSSHIVGKPRIVLFCALNNRFKRTKWVPVLQEKPRMAFSKISILTVMSLIMFLYAVMNLAPCSEFKIYFSLLWRAHDVTALPTN